MLGYQDIDLVKANISLIKMIKSTLINFMIISDLKLFYNIVHGLRKY